MEAVRETAVGSPGGRHETITLQAETRTPRARTLSACFVRERTPLGELPPARRQRKKNEGKGRARALGRLDPLKHEQYLEAERTRKKDAALRAARGEQVVRRTGKRSAVALQAAWSDVNGSTTAGLPSSPSWKKQARERVVAELQAAQQKLQARAAAGQKLREWRAALAPSARCGSCATCTQLIQFGGSKVRNAGVCESLLSRLGADPCESQWQALWASGPNSEIRVAFTHLDRTHDTMSLSL